MSFTVEEYVRPVRTPLTVEQFVNEYRRIYREGQLLFDTFKPCKIESGTCICGRDRNVKSFCCEGCKYLSPSGCLAEAIWCKLWLCGYVKGYDWPKDDPRQLRPEFKLAHRHLLLRANDLCRGVGGRLDLSDYIKHFYGEPTLKKWRTQETS
jgi:hypothetical protein